MILSQSREMPSPLPEPFGKCTECGGNTYWWDAWGETCGSWWVMEGGCEFKGIEAWCDWKWED